MFKWNDATSDGVAFSYQSRYFFIVGGYNKNYTSMATLTRYDTTTGNITIMTPMHVGRGDTGLAMLGDNAIVLGGWNSTVGFCQPMTAAESYSPSTNTWTTLASMSYGRGDLAVVAMGGHIFAIAGETKQSGDCFLSVPVPLVERYNPNDNTWVVEQSISSNLFRFVGASYNSSGDDWAIYLFGGQGSFDHKLLLFPLRYHYDLIIISYYY